MTTIVNKSIKRKQDLTQLVLIFIIIGFINIISSFVFTRFDLTSEKRFTLSKATKEFLGKLDDIVYVKVYLEGDFPAGFKRLRNDTKELLDEFRAYSKGNLEYEFINPSASSDPTERNNVYKQLSEKGLHPTNLESKDKGERTQRIIFPGAVLSYHGREYPLMLLSSQIGTAPEQMLNNSSQTLEYNIAYAIKNLISFKKKRIGFVQGHGELDKTRVADMTRTLGLNYDVDSVTIRSQLKALSGFDAIVIAKPDSLFNEKDKFILDQFIMKGGKVLWLIDNINASMDSLFKGGMELAYPQNLNLDDQLFKYGIRINPDLIQDLQAAPISVITGYMGNQPQQKVYPWFYFPIIFPTSNNPIVKNLNAIKFEFVSSIDTVAVPDLKKTILLATSNNSKILRTPVRVSLGMLRFEPDVKQYNRHAIPIAVLLEGQFQSVFTNRVPPEISNDKEIGFKTESEKTKMIVVSDGDIIKNEVRKSGRSILPLGYDRVTGETYGNKIFIMNCIDYLCDDSGLIAVRSKELKLRLLDRTRIEQERFRWQLINAMLPLLLIGGMGYYNNYRRKKYYTA